MDNSREQPHALVDPDKRQRGFSRGFLIAVSVIIIFLAVSIVVPVLKNRRHACGSACNGQLDSIYSAKEQVAFKAKIGSGSATIPLDVYKVNSFLRGTDIRDPCPHGGRYIVGDINAPDGSIIIPVCTHEQADAGSGRTRGQEGLCIHRRAFVQDASGEYHRRAELTFAYEIEQLETDSK